MKRVSGEDRQRIEFVGGGGVYAVIAFFFILTGILLGWSMLADGIVAGAIAFQLITLVGVILILGRTGCVFDARKGTYERWYGLMRPMKTRQEPLRSITKVTLEKEIRQSDKGSRTVYPVRFVEGEDSHSLVVSRSLEESRREAEFLAAALGIPLEDSSSGAVVVREGAHVDESLRERRRRTGEGVKLPDPPAAMTSRFSVAEDGVEIEMPSAGLGLGIIPVAFALVACVGFVIIVLIVASEMGRAPLPLVIACVVVVILGLGFSAWAVMNARHERTFIRVGRDALTVHKRGLGIGKPKTIPADELEELVIGTPDDPSTGDDIVARSDKLTLSFGGHLSSEERDWIKTVIENTVG